MRIEAQAIQKIIELEPTLIRTPEGNPGYDLYENDSNGQPIRWVEVKSMTGSLADRPVGLSRTQFDCARERGSAYWLYVVEHATDPGQARILRIQDPVRMLGRSPSIEDGLKLRASIRWPEPTNSVARGRHGLGWSVTAIQWLGDQILRFRTVGRRW